MSYSTNKGFIALMTVVFTSAFFATVVLSSLYSSYSTRKNIALFASKEQSYYTARSCTHVAILKLAQNQNHVFTPHEISPLCTVQSVTIADPNISIVMSSYVETVQTRLETTINQDFQIVSQKILENL